MKDNTVQPLIVPERILPVPDHMSDLARSMLAPRGELFKEPFPEVADVNVWRRYVDDVERTQTPLMKEMTPPGNFEVETLDIEGVRIHIVTPEGLAPDDRTIVFDMHGGALIFGGPYVVGMAKITAARLKARVWTVAYRKAPEHPFPAALEDGQKAYRALLERRRPEEIIMHGISAGGNLVAATLLKCRDEGMPLPAAAILQTPEVDLTESGDSFRTNAGIDPLGSLMPVNLLYANGHDLRSPYVSPLFADFTAGFPPTLLTAGTRDLFLSNTVRMHRALRAAGVPAELHVMEAAPHGNLPFTEECEAIDKDVRAFIRAHTS